MTAKSDRNDAAPMRQQKQQLMFSMIENWKKSGQSQQGFCKTQNVAYSVFHYWYKKYRTEENATSPSPFVAVQFQNIPSGSPVAELTLPDGRRLTFYRAVEASFLRTLLC